MYPSFETSLKQNEVVNVCNTSAQEDLSLRALASLGYRTRPYLYEGPERGERTTCAVLGTLLCHSQMTYTVHPRNFIF